MQHLRKGKSLALKIYDTLDKSAVKNTGECLFSCGHVIVCDFLDFVLLLFIYFFWSSPQKRLLNRPCYYGVRWRKQPHVRRYESRPAVLLHWLARTEGGISNRTSGTRSVRVSAQGLSRSCCKLSPMKIPSSRLAAPGSLRMAWCVIIKTYYVYNIF